MRPAGNEMVAVASRACTLEEVAVARRKSSPILPDIANSILNPLAMVENARFNHMSSRSLSSYQIIPYIWTAHDGKQFGHKNQVTFSKAPSQVRLHYESIQYLGAGGLIVDVSVCRQAGWLAACSND